MGASCGQMDMGAWAGRGGETCGYMWTDRRGLVGRGGETYEQACHPGASVRGGQGKATARST